MKNRKDGIFHMGAKIASMVLMLSLLAQEQQIEQQRMSWFGV